MEKLERMLNIMYHREWLFRKQSHYSFFWWLLVVIVLLLCFFIICFSYYPYYHVTGIYKKEEKYVSVLFENTKLETLDDVEIKIENEVIKKDDLVIIDYILVDNKIYNQANIYVEKEFDTQLVSISIKLPKTTLWKRIWKGMNK